MSLNSRSDLTIQAGVGNLKGSYSLSLLLLGSIVAILVQGSPGVMQLTVTQTPTVQGFTTTYTFQGTTITFIQSMSALTETLAVPVTVATGPVVQPSAQGSPNSTWTLVALAFAGGLVLGMLVMLGRRGKGTLKT